MGQIVPAVPVLLWDYQLVSAGRPRHCASELSRLIISQRNTGQLETYKVLDETENRCSVAARSS